jgi:predicted dehydrogenase
MDKVRWGIIGTGKIARAFAAALRDTPDAQLVAVGSRSAASAQVFANEFDVPQACASYESLVACSDVDLVYIATPHPMHAQNALMALEAGKGVLCEKPFTMNRREAEEVIALARSKNLFVMEAMWTRFLPAFAEVKRIIASGQLGDVRHVHADFGFTSTFGPEHRAFNPALGGGALLDLGIYPLSIASAILGPVDSVIAQATLGPTGVDVQTDFLLRHRDGGTANCSCSFLARSPGELTVSGERGHVRMNTMFYRAQSVTLVLEDGTNTTVATPYEGNGYVHEAVEAQRCWKAGLIESPAMTHDETLALMGVMDEIRRQVDVGYPSDISS